MKKLFAIIALAFLLPVNLFAMPKEFNIGANMSFPVKSDFGLTYGGNKIKYGRGYGVNAEFYLLPTSWFAIGLGGQYSWFDGTSYTDGAKFKPVAYSANLAAKLKLYYSDNIKFYIPFGAGYAETRLNLKNLSHLQSDRNNEIGYYAGLGMMWKSVVLEARYSHFPKPEVIRKSNGHKFEFNRFDQINILASWRFSVL